MNITNAIQSTITHQHSERMGEILVIQKYWSRKKINYTATKLYAY